MRLIDTHTHLDSRQYANELEQILQRATAAGVVKMVNIGFNLKSSRFSVELASKQSQIYAAVGYHPHDAKSYTEEIEKELIALLQQPKVVALGEIGLDYNRDFSPREVQRQVFKKQLGLAREYNLPVIVHTRDATEDTMQILKREGNSCGIMHCFSGSWETAKEVLRLGLHISVAGPVTFPNARKLHEVASNIPLDYLLLETDCPWLAPQEYRGKRNEPAYVRDIAYMVAALRGLDAETLAEATSTNAEALLGLE